MNWNTRSVQDKMSFQLRLSNCARNLQSETLPEKTVGPDQIADPTLGAAEVFVIPTLGAAKVFVIPTLGAAKVFVICCRRPMK